MNLQRHALCLDALYADLVLRTLLHDIRGKLAAVSGWAEVAALDGQSLPEGIDRGIEDLHVLMASSAAYRQYPSTETIPLADLLANLPGLVTSPPNVTVQACPQRLRAALWGAKPESIRIGKDLGEFAVIELSGLPAEGVALASRPILSQLKEIRDADRFDPRLCTALLHTATTACSGRLRPLGKTGVSISLRKRE